MGTEMIYFDNAATTWPKPSAVRENAVRFFSRYGGNPGRSGHRMSMDTAAQVYHCREAAAELFKPCMCGIFNTDRAAMLIRRIVEA